MRILTLAVCLALTSAWAQAQTQQKQYSLTLTDPDKPMHLELDIQHGSAKIIGYSGKTVEIKADLVPLSANDNKDMKPVRRWEKNKEEREEKPKRDRAGLKSIKPALFEVEIEENKNRVEIDSSSGSYAINLTIQVPSNASIDAEFYRGSGIEIEGISGAIEVETWRGGINAKGISGPIVAQTHTNDIVIALSSLSQTSPSSFTTHSGDIDITLAKSIASTLYVKNNRGEILSGLDADFVADEVEKRKSGDSGQRILLDGQLSAKVKGGGQSVFIATHSGDVYLRQP